MFAGFRFHSQWGHEPLRRHSDSSEMGRSEGQYGSLRLARQTGGWSQTQLANQNCVVRFCLRNKGCLPATPWLESTRASSSSTHLTQVSVQYLEAAVISTLGSSSWSVILSVSETPRNVLKHTSLPSAEPRRPSNPHLGSSSRPCDCTVCLRSARDTRSDGTCG